MVIRWGLVGCGDIAAKRVAGALNGAEGSALVAVARRRADLAAEFAARHGAKRWHADWRDLVRDDGVDAVYVATPVNLHAEQAVAVVAAGKHVLCEKPMALTPAECERMLAAARANGVRLGVAYYRHHYPIVARLRELIASGELGQPVVALVQAFEMFDPPPDHPRAWFLKKAVAGGGPMFDFGCHRIEVLLDLLGPVRTVHGFPANVRFRNRERGRGHLHGAARLRERRAGDAHRQPRGAGVSGFLRGFWHKGIRARRRPQHRWPEDRHRRRRSGRTSPRAFEPASAARAGFRGRDPEKARAGGHGRDRPRRRARRGRDLREGHMTTTGSLILAIVVSGGVVLSAPFVGQIRAALRAAFPGRFVAIVGGAVALTIGLAVVAALARIRLPRAQPDEASRGDRRGGRYGAIAAAILIGTAYISRFSTGNPEVDAVERVHFVQYGLVTLLFYRAWRNRGDLSSLILPVLAGLIVGTIEEWFQWFLPVRVGEARDVFLNLVAIACGLLFSLGLDPPSGFAPRLQPGSARLMTRLASAFALVFAMFFHAVHLGVEVEAESIGSFKSRFDHPTLAALAIDRAGRWKNQPPVVLRRLSREDQYMDEGLWHVRRRNDAWSAQDFFTAWRENRILEEFFGPVLDTPSYVSKSGHRWSPEQRADAERRAAGDTRPYVSDAEPRPILIMSKTAFWSLAAGLIVVLSAYHR